MLDEDQFEDATPKDNANTNGDTARIAASAWESLMLQVLASFMSADQHQALLASIQATPGQFQEGMAANAPSVNPVSLPGPYSTTELIHRSSKQYPCDDNAGDGYGHTKQ